jgi:hypothetical protein
MESKDDGMVDEATVEANIPKTMDHNNQCPVHEDPNNYLREEDDPYNYLRKEVKEVKMLQTII